MEDIDFAMNNLNAFNTMVSQLVFIDNEMEEENKCITLLCSLQNSWDNLVVAIGGTTQSLLTKFEDVDEFLLLEEMRIKYMEGCKDVLSVKDHPKERKNKYLWEISKYIGLYIYCST